MRRFYFTNDNAENVAEDYRGNIRGARTYAQIVANEKNETITINDCLTDEIEDFIYPDNYVKESEVQRYDRNMEQRI